MPRVLITGMGAFCPLGGDRRTTFDAALAGTSAIRPAQGEIAALLPNVLVAPVTEDPAARLAGSYNGHDRAAQFALVAAGEAMREAGIEPQPDDARRIGVYVGIGFGGACTVDGVYGRMLNAARDHRNPAVLHPLSVPRMMANAAAATISMHYGLRGPSNTYSIACASSAVAAGEAFRAIRDGYLDAAVVIGTEAMLTPGALLAWNALRVMARPDAADPAASCRPFALGRSGFVLGEGAAAMVLESASRSAARGRPALAELSGYGTSSDAAHLTAPSSVEQVEAMRQALAQAGLEPADIGYLNAHGTATDAGDVVEAESIRTVFGAAAAQLPVSSTKSVHGHLIGASGMLELVISVMAMLDGALPPTATLDVPDPRCALDHIAREARRGVKVDAVMSNSFAFGGSNASLVARRVPA